jgi:hypothetical protein
MVVKILISRLLIFILFLYLLMSVRFQVSVFGFQRTEARRQKTHGENWRMKHPYCPLFSVLRHLIADT